MSNSKHNNNLRVRIQSDKPVVPIGKPGERIVEITLIAPPSTGDKPHIPLNLSLVIDRSGSMQGKKLQYAKEAALHVIDLMSEKDRLAVVAYDDKVTTLMSSQLLSDSVKDELKSRIMTLQAGASTFLYGGWLAGSREVAEAINDESVNRTLLLSDGLANVGERNINALSIHAQELFLRHISTSCFGVGLDYDEHLLESMANHGGGRFQFLETLQAIPLVFEREFEELISIYLRDVQIKLDLPASAKASVYANWHSEMEGSQLKIFLGSLASGQKRSIYIKLTQLQGKKGDHLEIPVTVTGRDAEGTEQAISTALKLKSIDQQKEAAALPDSELMARFAVVDLAQKANEALQRERAGDRAGSVILMRNSLYQHSPNVSESDRRKYERMQAEMSRGLSEEDRKRHHYQEYQSRRGSQFIRDYSLDFVKGLPLVRVEGLSVLINTAVNRSFGAPNEWLFLNEMFPLLHQYDGMTVKNISAALEKKVDVVLGMDILQRLFVHIDPNHRVMVFSQRPIHSHQLRPIDRSAWLSAAGKRPIVELFMAETMLKMQLMTALNITLLPEYILQSSSPIHQDEILLPGLVKMTAPIYKLPIRFLEREFQLECASLPASLEQQLGMHNDEGLLGVELFRKIPSYLSFPEQELALVK